MHAHGTNKSNLPFLLPLQPPEPVRFVRLAGSGQGGPDLLSPHQLDQPVLLSRSSKGRQTASPGPPGNRRTAGKPRRHSQATEAGGDLRTAPLNIRREGGTFPLQCLYTV